MEKQVKIVWTGLGTLFALLLIAAAHTSFSSTFLLVRGTDRYEYHWPVTGDHTVSQELTLEAGALHRIGVILVPFPEKPQGVVRLRVENDQGKVLRESYVRVEEVKDDQFTFFEFPELRGMKGQKLRLTLSAVTALPTRVAARFDSNSSAIPSGQASKDDEVLSADLALELQRPAAWYGYLHDQIARHPDSAREIRMAVLVGLIIGGMYVLMTALSGVPDVRIRVSLLLAVFLGIALATTAARLSVMDEIRGESGGDQYNFFAIAERIRTEFDFYHPEEKRLPVFAALLLPGKLFTNDYLLIARIANQLAIGAALLCLALIGLQMGLPRGAVFLGVLLAASSRDILLTGMRPLAYPVTAALLFAGMAVLFSAQSKPRNIAAASLLFGLASQTRHEAMPVSFVILLAAALIWLFEKRRGAAFAALAPWLIVIAPFFIANLQNFGDPFHTGYNDHPVTNIHRSWNELSDQLSLSWGVIGSTWWEKWLTQSRIPLKAASLGICAALGAAIIGWPKLKEKISVPAELRAIGIVFAAAGTIWFWWKFLHEPGIWRYQATVGLVALAGIGTLALLWEMGESVWQRMRKHARQPHQSWVDQIFVRQGLVITAGLLLFGIATWVHPVEKTYYPFLFLMGLAAGIGLDRIIRVLAGNFTPRFGNILSLWLGASLLIGIAAVPLIQIWKTFPVALDATSRKQVHDFLTYEAGRWLATQDGVVAAHHELLPFTLFLPGRIAAFPDATKDPTPAELEKIQTRWIVWVSNDPLFKTYAGQPEAYPVRFTRKAQDQADNQVEMRVLEVAD